MDFCIIVQFGNFGCVLLDLILSFLVFAYAGEAVVTSRRTFTDSTQGIRITEHPHYVCVYFQSYL